MSLYIDFINKFYNSLLEPIKGHNKTQNRESKAQGRRGPLAFGRISLRETAH